VKPQMRIWMSERAWAPYEPSDKSPWNRRRVVHLHRRAGFAATLDEIHRDLKDGPAPSIGRLLAGKSREGRVPDGFEATAKLLADSAVASGDPARLKAWWIFRMLVGPDPLGERLTLFWHNHFATSNAKVEDVSAMRKQNETFRELARAPFGQLLERSLKEPALLAWLDAPSNRKGHPNENLARELLELFTLGIDHFNETDVKEAARALTGWTVKDGAFVEALKQHDDDEKIILGQTGRWSTSDLLNSLAENPSTARRIASKLCSLFLGESVVDKRSLDALADGLRANDLNISWGVETILRSREFFNESNIGNRVLGPTEFVVGSAIALGRLDPPPSTLLLADWAARLGQDLFYPPNVGGWTGGRSWLAARGLIGRANYAAALVGGSGVGSLPPLDALALANREAAGDAILAASQLVLARDPEPSWRDRIVSEVGSTRDADTTRRVFTIALASAEAQLG
jgi:uncharacterized protein (DUF1800 family)